MSVQETTLYGLQQSYPCMYNIRQWTFPQSKARSLISASEPVIGTHTYGQSLCKKITKHYSVEYLFQMHHYISKTISELPLRVSSYVHNAQIHQ